MNNALKAIYFTTVMCAIAFFISAFQNDERSIALGLGLVVSTAASIAYRKSVRTLSTISVRSDGIFLLPVGIRILNDEITSIRRTRDVIGRITLNVQLRNSIGFVVLPTSVFGMGCRVYISLGERVNDK